MQCTIHCPWIDNYPSAQDVSQTEERDGKKGRGLSVCGWGGVGCGTLPSNVHIAIGYDTLSSVYLFYWWLLWLAG
jgi:hypothetical protein